VSKILVDLDLEFEITLWQGFLALEMHTNITSPAAEYGSLARNFSAFHQNHANILLHLLTTPLGFVGLSSAILSATQSTSVVVFIVVSYLLFLVPSLSVGTFVSTTLLCIAVILLSRHLKLKFLKSVLIICAAYSAQDLAHWLTEEKTFQATYSNGGQVTNYPILYHANVTHRYPD
jgi:hypothetical protein